MSKVTVLDNERAVLWFHPESKIVHHEIKKYVFGKELREILDKGYDLFKEKGAQKWLSDDRRNGAIGQEDSQWARNDWFPRVLAAGWKYWALVLPEAAMGQINMKKWAEEYAQAGITARIFSDPDEALKWLESQ